MESQHVLGEGLGKKYHKKTFQGNILLTTF